MRFEVFESAGVAVAVIVVDLEFRTTLGTEGGTLSLTWRETHRFVVWVFSVNQVSNE